ncbi:MAG: hypothetical protein ACOYEW_11250 [Anaerolineae bacterium]
MVAKGLNQPPRVPGLGRNSAPYLARALLAVEGRLHFLYSQHDPEDQQHRMAAIAAATDPRSPLWDEFFQITYLENIREGLRSTLQALDPRHGRQP